MRRRISPGPAIGLVALVVALGGTSYAAFGLPKNSVGTKQLKNYAVTSAKIRNGAVTAAKINTSGLTVPNSTNATHATDATNATNASNAANAATANNADELGGHPPSAYLGASELQTTSGMKFFSPGQTDQSVITFGPFSYTVDCYSHTANPDHPGDDETRISLNYPAGAFVDGTMHPLAGSVTGSAFVAAGGEAATPGGNQLIADENPQVIYYTHTYITVNYGNAGCGANAVIEQG
jgi:hypothetical protein